MSVKCCAVAVVLVAVCWVLLPPLLAPSPSLPPVWGGNTHKHFKRVQQIFSRLVEDGRIKGGSVAAYYRGELVVNLWGGYADQEAQRPWNKDTVTVFYSTTKLVGAVVIARMVDKGLLEYGQHVSSYWPEFAQHGKDNITVEMLLSHQAGLAVPDGGISVLDLVDYPDKVESFLARQKPRYPPGSRFGYHGLTWGLYVDTLARKVDPQHRNMSQIFQQDIAQPFGIDFHVGLPLELHHRMARVYPGTFWQALWAGLRGWSWEEIRRLYLYSPYSGGDWAATTRTFNELQNQYFVNNPDLNAVGVTSYSGQGGARGVAKLCSILANNGSYQGKQLLSPRQVSRLQTLVVEGVGDTLLQYVRFGPGTILKTNPQGQTVFGHPGFGSQVGFADTHTGLGFAYCTNHLTGHHIWTDPVILELQQAVYDSIQRLQS